MRRRDFITLLGTATATWPRATHAQQREIPVVGLLSTRAASDDINLVAAMYQGLKEVGYTEGQNLAIESRFAANEYGRLQQLAAELVQARVAVITTMGTAAAPAAKAATSTIPIVFGIGDDPVKLGLVVLTRQRPRHQHKRQNFSCTLCCGDIAGFVSPWISIAIYVMVVVMWLVPDRRIESVLREASK